ncbi:helix-turn-helix transcriptional regulator [Vagococcus lutrae]|uniref:helix-turn-helix transcriptional regulator n=1 Tax=Vagococcus lutrae TaxID=81947 RepID=UPI00200BC48A|nr:helix-turn-helix transcriptional regulator [Vagococcus lutrae]MDT2825060.1 helix-turn-helix transcriptional regulator [Vagococcus lutrae]UQF19812.1 helix-turn-helix domain-containing protein [Vagococcus lutrae]
MNQIKKARTIKNISQSELAKRLNLTQQAISYYENGSREPSQETWEKIASILDVPVEFLKGKTDDPDGWAVWEETTGYDKKQIENEINRMKKANHIIGSPDNFQNIIAQAVANLDGMGNTDKGILDHTASSIGVICDQLNQKYIDPNKINSFQNPTLTIFPANAEISKLIYDDLNPEAYQKAINILQKARNDLKKIPFDLDLK